MQKSHVLVSYLALMVGIVFLSLSGIFIHWAQAPGIVTSFYRMLIASSVLLPVVIWKFRTTGLPKKRVLVFPLLGGLMMSLDYAFWSTSLSYTRIANATLLNNIAPLWVALFAFLIWRQQLSGRFWIGLALTLTGAGIVLGNDLIAHPQFGFGDLLALISSVFWAGYYLATQRGRNFIESIVYIWMVEVVCLFCLGGASLVMRLPMTGFPLQTWLAFLGAALITQIAGHFLLAFSLGKLPAAVVSPTMISQPVITSLLAIPLAGQALAAGQWLGMVTVLVGIYLVNKSRVETPQPAEEIALQPVQET